jgi:two-component system, OmpR family, response regulator
MLGAMQVVLLEDDLDLGQAVADHLVAAGHCVEWHKLAGDAEARFATAPGGVAATDLLLLLDLRLPDDDGLELLRRLRVRGVRSPVIVLTARDQVSDRIRGLQAGADDYLVKPFDLDEMLARIDAVSRRIAKPRPRLLELRTMVFDFEARIARRSDERINLTAMEWDLLACLARRPGRIWSRDEIEQSIGGEFGRERFSNSVQVIVSRLRRKLGRALITTHRGLGYRLEH